MKSVVNKISGGNNMSTFLDYYNLNYGSKLMEIDLFLKTESSDDMPREIVMDLLSLCKEEMEGIMKSFCIDHIDVPAFFVIMQNGSSPICRLFSREVQRKMPYFYSFYDISYIYQIPYEHVVDGANKANMTSITSENIHKLFSYIEMKPTYTDKKIVRSVNN